MMKISTNSTQILEGIISHQDRISNTPLPTDLLIFWTQNCLIFWKILPGWEKHLQEEPWM